MTIRWDGPIARALAVSSIVRFPEAPEIPAVAEHHG
jgi:hypothetical protein